MNAHPPRLHALLRQALEVYRKPLSFLASWKDPRRALPGEVGDLLGLALAPPELLDGHAARLDVSEEELRAAIHFFIRQVLLAEENDPHRVLGLTPAATPGEIRSNYHKLMRLYHPDRDADNEWNAVYAPRINRAYQTLRAQDGRKVDPGGGGGRARPRAPKDSRRVRKSRRPRLLSGLKATLARGRSWSRRRKGWGMAVSFAAVAAGVGFIAWNLLAWPELEWPEPPIGDGAGMAAVAPPASFGLSVVELNSRVLDRLAAAYRQGDLSALSALFSEHAMINDLSGQEAIRREYARFFAATRQRELRLGNFQWRIDRQNARGIGTYSLKVSTIENNAAASYQGTLIIDVEEGPEGPLISGFFQDDRGAP